MTEWTEALDHYYESLENNMSVDLSKPDTDGMPAHIRGGLISTPTQWDLDRLAAQYEALLDEARAVATDLHDQIVALNSKVTTLSTMRIEANNERHNFKREVGNALSEFFQEFYSNDEWADDAVALFTDLGLEDYLPTKSFTITLSISATADIEVEAKSEEDARRLVMDEMGCQEIHGEIDYYGMEYEVDGIEQN